MLSFDITLEDHCRRAESFLQNLLPRAPLAYLKKMVKSGHVTVNGGAVSSDDILCRGDRVQIKESRRTLDFLQSAKPALDILYEDDRIIVFNKPAGLPMHRTAEDGSNNLVEEGQRFLAWRGTACTLRPVNRLDRGTSGAVVLAKSSTAAGMFGRMVKEEGLDKLYLALAEGTLRPEGTIAEPLDGKESLTHCRLLYHQEGVSFAALYPITGRMHQIRRHLQVIGHPILGDLRYGGRQLDGWSGHALHSFRTALVHPETGRELVVYAPLPPDFIAYLRRFAGAEFTAMLAALPEIPPPLA